MNTSRGDGHNPAPVSKDDGSLKNDKETHRNFAQVIAERAADRPEQIAVMTSDRRLTFAQLDDLVTRCAGLLHRSGLTQNANCALVFQDELTFMIVWLATARLQVTSVSLTPSSTASQWTEFVHLCQVSNLVSDHELNLPGLSCVQITMDDIQGAAPVSLSGLARSKCEHDLLHVGSGSTGKPKVIAIPFGGVDLQIPLIARSYDFGPGHVFYSFVNLTFVSGLRIGLASLAAGGAMYLRGAGTESIVDGFGRCGIDRVYTTVVHTEKLIEFLQHRNRRLGDHIDYRIGSSVVTDELIGRAKKHISENVSIGYGTNEIGSVTVLPRAWKARPQGSVGYVLRGIELEIVDASGTVVPVNQPGEIRLRAPGMFSGYLGDKEATANALRDGWFYPGDTGRISEDGHLILHGRSDHMMIFDGINIYPAEIETTMADHEAVKDVAVLPMKHRVHQDIPVCAVALHPDRQASEEELLKFGRDRLGARAAKLVFIVDAIPRNDLGKLVRSSMAQMLTARMKARSA